MLPITEEDGDYVSMISLVGHRKMRYSGEQNERKIRTFC